MVVLLLDFSFSKVEQLISYKHLEADDISETTDATPYNANQHTLQIELNELESQIQKLLSENQDEYINATNKIIDFVQQKCGNAFRYLNHTSFYLTFQNILSDAPIREKHSLLIILVDAFITLSQPKAEIKNLLSEELFNINLYILNHSTDEYAIQKSINFVIHTMTQFQEFSSTLINLNYFENLLVIELINRKSAAFQNSEPYLTNESLLIEALMHIFRVSYENISDYQFGELLSACVVLICNGLTLDITNSSIRSVISILSIDPDTTLRYIEENHLEQPVMFYSKHENSEIAYNSLNLMYQIVQRVPLLFDIDEMILCIQKYLVRRGSNSDINFILISCKIAAIYLSNPDFHEVFANEGIISQLAALIKDQSVDVKTESFLALKNIIIFGSNDAINYIFSNYVITKPMILLLDVENQELEHSIIKSCIKIDSIARAFNILTSAAKIIKNEIDYERLEEIAENSENMNYKIAQKLINILSDE